MCIYMHVHIQVYLHQQAYIIHACLRVGTGAPPPKRQKSAAQKKLQTDMNKALWGTVGCLGSTYRVISGSLKGAQVRAILSPRYQFGGPRLSQTMDKKQPMC